MNLTLSSQERPSLFTASEESDFHSTSKAGITNLSVYQFLVGLSRPSEDPYNHPLSLKMMRVGTYSALTICPVFAITICAITLLLREADAVKSMLCRRTDSLQAVQTLALQREIYDLDPGGPTQSAVCFQSFLCPVFHLQCPLLFLAQIWHGLRARVIWHPLAALADPLALHSQ